MESWLYNHLWDILLSAGMFVAVVLLIVAVFGQPGRAQLSPQREAAIATGHADRRTVFERSLIRPIAWLMLLIAHKLPIPAAKRWIHRRLVAAGSPNYYTEEEYLALSLLTGLALGLMLEVFYMAFTGIFSWAMAMLGFLAGVILTIYQIYDKSATRTRRISRQIPYTLDLIALAMGAGATFTEAVKTVVRENPDEPFNVELKTLLAEMELGTTRRVALQNLSGRIPLDVLRSIIASVIQSEQLGTPLAEVLHSQATLLRLQRTVRAENAAAVASVRILLPGLVILMSVVLAVFAPMIVRAIREGLF